MPTRNDTPTLCYSISLALTLCLCTLVTNLNSQDTIVFTTGQEYVGEILTKTPDKVEFQMGDKTRSIPFTAIKEIRGASSRSVQYHFDKWRHEDGYYCQEVVKLPGASKDEIYSGALVWVAETFNNAEAVLEMDDREAGILIGTGWVNQNGNRLYLTMKIEAREERFRFRMYEVRQEFVGGIAGGLVLSLDMLVAGGHTKLGQLRSENSPYYKRMMRVFEQLERMRLKIRNIEPLSSDDDDW